MGDGDCGLDFEVGRLTFVHAWHSRTGDEITVSLCGTSTTRDLGADQVDYARTRAAGTPDPAIFGKVRRAPAYSLSGGGGAGLAGATVTATGHRGVAGSATTDAEGLFTLPGPLAGTFTVRAEVPGRAAPVELEVEVAGRCWPVELVVGG